MVPLQAIPLLREDRVRSGRLRYTFEMMETVEVLMNAINVRVRAYLIPMLALERFNGSMDQLNLSYEGLPPLEGEDVVPFIETGAFGAHAANDVYKYLGLHGREAENVNTAYLEAYNCLWNFLAKNRSPDLDLRTRLQADLAPAFWMHDRFKHIVPDFDQAVIDGEVALNIVNPSIPLSGTSGPVNMGPGGGAPASFTGVSIDENRRLYAGAPATTGYALQADLTEITAELQADGITVSLANIRLAEQTRAFAYIRQQYNMHPEHIINLLMDGINIPDQALKQPILLADRRTIFGMSKRHAMDAGNLTESVVNGATQLDLSVQVPRIGTGGIIMIVAEITPDQLFERQEDPFLQTLSADALPHYLRDYLDPEKVDIVKNSRVDVAHSTPDGTFGYEPLNARWNVDTPRVGGKFYRPEANTAFDEDRQRIWSVETLNPTLSTDFYLCTDIHTKPFVVTNQDPFEAVTVGEMFIEGNTVFGGHLVEATNDYEKVLENVDQTRIEKEPAE
jgi:hypothetical protein